MAFGSTTIWDVRSSGNDTNNGGGFDQGNANMATDLAATSATGSSPVVTSATYNFAAGDVGHWVYVKSGTNWTPGWYQIASVAANAATLTAGVGTVPLTTKAMNTVAGCATVASPTSGTWTIDYSQADSPRISFTDMVIGVTTTTFTSVANPITTAMVGNTIAVTSGTGFTVQRVQVSSVNLGSLVATCDKSLGTTGSTGGNGGLGGALASPGMLGSLIGTLNGNMAFVASATYNTSASNNVSGGNCTIDLTSSGSTAFLLGYQTTRYDYGTKPILKANANSQTVMSLMRGTIWFRNFEIQGTGKTTITGIQSGGFSGAANIFIVDCKVKDCDTVGIKDASSASTFLFKCEVTGCSGTVANGAVNISVDGNCLAVGCYIHDNTVNGGTFNGTRLIACIFDTNTGGSTQGAQFNSNKATAIGCVAYGNGQHGFAAMGTCNMVNCIAETNTGTGFQGMANTQALFNCAAYNNGTNFDSTTVFTNIGSITGTASFFTNAAAADFSLNNTSGGGAGLRATGYPTVFPAALTTNYLDVGAAQHTTTAGGLYVHPGMTGGPRG